MLVGMVVMLLVGMMAMLVGMLVGMVGVTGYGYGPIDGAAGIAGGYIFICGVEAGKDGCVLDDGMNWNIEADEDGECWAWTWKLVDAVGVDAGCKET